jgi:hypothetical protein
MGVVFDRSGIPETQAHHFYRSCNVDFRVVDIKVAQVHSAILRIVAKQFAQNLLCNLLLLWSFRRWRPLWYFEIKIARRLLWNGGIIARHVRHKRVTDVGVACPLFLPFLINPLEPALFKRDETRILENVIDIKVSPKAIWDQIKSVPEIHKNELSPSWSHRIGFPDPISATLSFEGVGGVRRASFAGGLLFVESVDVWEPEKRLSFSIHPQTAGIPATTLDEHVTVGGPYFDVLRGEYRIEPLTNGVTRLHLHSQHRLSTEFNSYARWWTDALMSDLQKTILLVVQRRAEAKERLAHN